MADEIDRIRHKFEAAISEAIAAFEELRAATRAQPDPSPTPDQPEDWLGAKQAEHKFGVSRSFLYKHAIKQLKVKDGFAARAGNGDIEYSQSRLQRYLELKPPRGHRGR